VKGRVVVAADAFVAYVVNASARCCTLPRPTLPDVPARAGGGGDPATGEEGSARPPASPARGGAGWVRDSLVADEFASTPAAPAGAAATMTSCEGGGGLSRENTTPYVA
jgi:hypothetical protein